MRTWFKARITWDSEDEGDEVKICHISATWFTMSRTMHAKDLYRMKSHSQDTRLGTQSIIHYEIVSVDVYDIFPTTKNPNEVMIKLWENNKQPPWDKPVHEKEERELKQLSRHRKIPGYLIQNARARHRIKISERGKDACNSFVRCSIGIILVAIRSILRFRQSISQPQEIQKPDAFEKPHGKGVNWKGLTGRTLRLGVYGERVKTVLK